jgi:hypothetical protein
MVIGRIGDAMIGSAGDMGCTSPLCHSRHRLCTEAPKHMTFSILKIAILFLLASVVACISWTVTHEEIFREIRDKCKERSQTGRWYVRKFYYVFTCEYCFSHYVTMAILALTGFKLLLDDWRGYVLAFFPLVWIANHYMSIYNRLRLEIKTTNLEGELKESVLKTKLDENVQQLRRTK